MTNLYVIMSITVYTSYTRSQVLDVVLVLDNLENFSLFSDSSIIHSFFHSFLFTSYCSNVQSIQLQANIKK